MKFSRITHEKQRARSEYRSAMMHSQNPGLKRLNFQSTLKDETPIQTIQERDMKAAFVGLVAGLFKNFRMTGL